MNKAILLGRATNDPKVTYNGDMAISSFTLAVDRRFKKDGEATADFINCKAFGKTAEWEEKYVRKGTKLCLEGHIQTGSYTNKEGNKVYTTEVIVDSQEFAESKSNNSESREEAPAPKANDDFMNVPDNIQEELPFV